MKKSIIVIRHIAVLIGLMILLLTAKNGIAQVENINTDRPDQSDGVYTIPKNRFQIEEGVTAAKNTFLNNFMLRFGLTNSTEIRLLSNAGNEAGLNGFQPFVVSAKQRIIQQYKILPAITIVGYASFETLASKDFRGNKIPVNLKLAFENDLNDKFSVSYNAGFSNKFKALDLTFEIGYAPNNKVSTFVEYFSTIQGHYTEHNADAGVLFVPIPELQFDVAFGHSIASSESRFYSTFGVSYIFRKEK